MLLELLKKGDPESEKKIGSGVESFQVRIHPAYESRLRSFFLVREDGSMEDFCYMKCVDNILPLPEEFKQHLVGPCSCHHEEDGEGGVTLGLEKFRTSTEIVLYFRKFLYDYPKDIPVDSEVCHNILWNLLRKGDPEWGEKKTRCGSVQSFLIRECVGSWIDRSLSIVWENGSTELFDIITCVDNILPLSQEYKYLSANTAPSAGKSTRGGRGRGRVADKGTRRGGRGGLSHT
ncbi:Protein EMBRYO DEFECTIVE 514 [Linum grandiflorum]